MNKELLQERKKMIYDFICDELYVPMKAKEMALAKGKKQYDKRESLKEKDDKRDMARMFKR